MTKTRLLKPGFFVHARAGIFLMALQPNTAALKLPDPDFICCKAAERERDRRKSAFIAKG